LIESAISVHCRRAALWRSGQLLYKKANLAPKLFVIDARECAAQRRSIGRVNLGKAEVSFAHRRVAN
jgi:hypothetical protein